MVTPEASDAGRASWKGEMARATTVQRSPVDNACAEAETPAMPSPVVFFQIATADYEKSKAFYSALFDWDLGPSQGGPILASIDPKGPADFDPKGSFLKLPEGAPPFITIFVRVDDVWATMAKAEELGAELVVPTTQIPGGPHLGIIRTPEGHSIGIVQA